MKPKVSIKISGQWLPKKQAVFPPWNKISASKFKIQYQNLKFQHWKKNFNIEPVVSRANSSNVKRTVPKSNEPFGCQTNRSGTSRRSGLLGPRVNPHQTTHSYAQLTQWLSYEKSVFSKFTLHIVLIIEVYVYNWSVYYNTP